MRSRKARRGAGSTDEGNTMSRSGTKSGTREGGGADCREGIARQRNKRRKRKAWNPGCTWQCAKRRKNSRESRRSDGEAEMRGREVCGSRGERGGGRGGRTSTSPISSRERWAPSRERRLRLESVRAEATAASRMPSPFAVGAAFRLSRMRSGVASAARLTGTSSPAWYQLPRVRSRGRSRNRAALR